MKQEDKELLLKDLCARLPYGVICHYNCVAEYDTMVIQKANCINKLEGIIPFFNGQIGYMVGGDKVNALSGDIKPYLRPMSSMTEEEWEELNYIGYIVPLYDGCFGVDMRAYCKNSQPHYRRFSEFSTIEDWLNAHHFDYRGLIERGLAIAVTEDNNPYK